ncbi:hypothetical protein AB0N93_14030 [Streptomyces sp. NPDC091267]|uniref:hypothetical protein n=1 Tax=Streptomyces sp. NPDC091267 TaxID=3155195 RepID=UPI00343FDAA1
MATARPLLSRDLPPLFETPDLPGAQTPVPQGHWCPEFTKGARSTAPETAPGSTPLQYAP